MEELYAIALGMVPGIGNVVARRLFERAGSARGVFEMNRRELMKTPGIRKNAAESLFDRSVFEKARQELEYIRGSNIECIHSGSSLYPSGLLQCEDAPLVLFAKGDINMEGRRSLSIVGTRRPTSRGLETCRKLVEDLADKYPDLVIVSGLAYGIDHCAHRAALDCSLRTLAVLAHGFRYMYPAVHRSIAREIEKQGALISDFPSCEKPGRQNFIKRNRIIAGLAEATVVVESGVKGGALVTADLANGYNREVFTFPGRISDPGSAGCNKLIKSHRAVLLESVGDLEYILGWESESGKKNTIQGSLFDRTNPLEKEVIQILAKEGDSSMDMLCYHTGLQVGQLSGILLGLEISGYILVHPGEMYSLSAEGSRILKF